MINHIRQKINCLSIFYSSVYVDSGIIFPCRQFYVRDWEMAKTHRETPTPPLLRHLNRKSLMICGLDWFVSNSSFCKRRLKRAVVPCNSSGGTINIPGHRLQLIILEFLKIRAVRYLDIQPTTKSNYEKTINKQ